MEEEEEEESSSDQGDFLFLVTSMYDGVCRSGTRRRRRRRQTKENSDRHILINFCGISINGICVLKKKKDFSF